MKTVYIVTQGEYSDYRIVAVFLDKAIAERCAVDTVGDIEEWEIGTIIPKLPEYSVDIAKDGTILYVNNRGIWGDDHNGEYRGPFSEYSYDKIYTFTMRAKDKEHAIKIANEKRARAIAKEIEE